MVGSQPIKCLCGYLLDTKGGVSVYCSSFNRPRGGRGAGGLQPHHLFENYKELLRKRCFQPPPPSPPHTHFEPLVSPPPPSPATFKVGPRSLFKSLLPTRTLTRLASNHKLCKFIKFKTLE